MWRLFFLEFYNSQPSIVCSYSGNLLKSAIRPVVGNQSVQHIGHESQPYAFIR